MAKRAFNLDVFIAQGVGLLRGRKGYGTSEAKQPQTAKHPLLKAAQDYVEEIKRYEAACETQGVYNSADKAKIKYRRLTLHSKTFTKLIDTVNTGLAEEASASGLSKDIIDDLIKAAFNLKQIGRDPRSAIYLAAEKHFRSLDQGVPKSEIKALQSYFINKAEHIRGAEAERDRWRQNYMRADHVSGDDLMRTYGNLATMATRADNPRAARATKREP